MAFCLASATAPSERITWTTVGSASGMAAIARAIGRDEEGLGRLAPREAQHEHDDHRAPARPRRSTASSC